MAVRSQAQPKLVSPPFVLITVSGKALAAGSGRIKNLRLAPCGSVNTTLNTNGGDPEIEDESTNDFAFDPADLDLGIQATRVGGLRQAGALQVSLSVFDPCFISGSTMPSPTASPIRVLIADDSPFLCRVLGSLLHQTPGFQVVGLAHDGLRAVELAKKLKPDVITLDIEMPGLDGIDALQSIMRDVPTPVIMVSGISSEAADVTLRAMQLGAVDFILKYTPGIDTDPTELRREIISKVRAAAGVKVIRLQRTLLPHRPCVGGSLPHGYRPGAEQPKVERSSHEADNHRGKPDGVRTIPPSVRPPRPSTRDVVVIGASTGGPAALRELLSELPADFPLPIIVVQHLPPTFTNALAIQLDRQLELAVREAQHGDVLEPGVVLIAPGEKHLLVSSDLRIELSDGPKIAGNRPAIDVTLQSVTQTCGARAIGVLLTGMGEDGAEGLSLLKKKGGTTFAQSEESCVVFGMPRRAIELDAAQHIGSPQEIGQQLAELGEAMLTRRSGTSPRTRSQALLGNAPSEALLPEPALATLI